MPDDEYAYEDWCDPVPRAFCDVYEVHERHVYGAVNGNVYDCPGLSTEELDEINAYDPGTCEHGLRADLCSGPNHYGEHDE